MKRPCSPRHHAILAGFIWLTPAIVAATVVAADFGEYREFRLGTTAVDVMALGRAAGRDLRTLHERPALLQELTWRPPYTSDRTSADLESIDAIVFSFVDDQLFRMAIDYDRRRTAGLTREDMLASVSAVYGARSARAVPATPRPAFGALDSKTTVGRWDQGDTAVELTQSSYSGSFGLVITSVPLEARARKAQAAAVIMDVREAPAREAARAKAQADEAREAAEKTRTTNKATFKP